MSARQAGGARRRAVPFTLLPTNLPGAYTSPAPPPGFDPLTASPAALAACGIFFRPPGPDDDRRLREAWVRMARRGWRPEDRIVPRLQSHAGVSHRLRGARQRDDGSYTSDNWSGASVAAPQGRRWSGAMGIWTVPTVDRPAGSIGVEGDWNSSSWVGLDGAYGSCDVLHAGVEQRLDAQGNASYVAWCEWFAPAQDTSPAYIWQTDIVNFAVAAGDVVYCSTQYLATRAGHVFFANETTGQHFSLTLRPPPGALLQGEAAEWIMETPDFGEGLGSVPAFSPVRFENALCCGADIPSGDPGDGDTWIIQGFGITLTRVSVASGSVTIARVG
jgi:hypothetical protein